MTNVEASSSSEQEQQQQERQQQAQRASSAMPPCVAQAPSLGERGTVAATSAEPCDPLERTSATDGGCLVVDCAVGGGAVVGVHGAGRRDDESDDANTDGRPTTDPTRPLWPSGESDAGRGRVAEHISSNLRFAVDTVLLCSGSAQAFQALREGHDAGTDWNASCKHWSVLADSVLRRA